MIGDREKNKKINFMDFVGAETNFISDSWAKKNNKRFSISVKRDVTEIEYTVGETNQLEMSFNSR